MKELTKEQIITVFDALLGDGADNSDISTLYVHEGTTSQDLCGYGDKALGQGWYLLVWDTTDENDQRFPFLYDKLNGISKDDYDVLLSNEEGDNDCVIIFRLTSE